MVEAMKKGCKLLVDFIDQIHKLKLYIEKKQKKASFSRSIRIFQNNLHDKKDKFDTTKRGFKALINLTKVWEEYSSKVELKH
jgi:superfamily I DNA/RNA helicase